MSKYLGIDYGDVRIGLALADDQRLALPYGVVHNDRELYGRLTRVVESERITEVVVGWPKSLTGMENRRTARTEEFIAELSKRMSLPVHRFDERMTTSAAAKQGLGSKARDAAAATYILQSYLDAHGPSASI